MTMDLFQATEREAAIDAVHSMTAIYTADPVVEALLDHVEWPSGEGKLVDTSCGDGAFVGAALTRLLAQRPLATPTEVLSRIAGWEFHFFAAGEARARVRGILRQHGWAADTATLVSAELVKEGDFLTECRGSRFRTIVGNPPYLRRAFVPGVLQTSYDQALPAHATGDLLHSFLQRSADLLEPGGKIALVTSDRWVSSEGAAQLREALGERLGIHRLDRLDVTTAFYRPKLRVKGTPPRIHPVLVVMGERSTSALPLTRAGLYPEEDQHVPTGLSLSAIATVKLAPWLGTDGVFLIPKEEDTGLPTSHLVPAMDTDDVKDGVLHPTTRFAIKTAPGETPPEAVTRHLAANAHKMCARGRRQDWLPPERMDNIDLTEPCLVIPRIAKHLKPILVPSGTLPVNHNLIVQPVPGVSLERVAAALSHPSAERWIRVRANRLENGYFAVTAKLLRELPLDEPQE